jgi:hypothetical protein
MIYFEVVFDNERRTAVSIRRVSLQDTTETYVYVITPPGQKSVKGTLTHSGPEDFRLISAVLDDYAKNYTPLIR